MKQFVVLPIRPLDVDLIIHSGDFTQRAVLDGLRTIGQVKAVRGNVDSIELKRILPGRDVFEVIMVGKSASYMVRVHLWELPKD